MRTKRWIIIIGVSTVLTACHPKDSAPQADPGGKVTPTVTPSPKPPEGPTASDLSVLHFRLQRIKAGDSSTAAVRLGFEIMDLKLFRQNPTPAQIIELYNLFYNSDGELKTDVNFNRWETR